MADICGALGIAIPRTHPMQLNKIDNVQKFLSRSSNKATLKRMTEQLFVD